MDVKNKHVYVYSPSGAVRDKAAFKRGVRRLEQLGCDVEIDPSALESCMRFAGDDDTRIAAIERAAQSKADVALISRGGYGLTRLLGRIPYKTIDKAVERGTQFVGMSDFTALQMALYAERSTVTWAGPALCEGFGPPVEPSVANSGPDEIMEACFEDLLWQRGEATGWRVSTDSAKALETHTKDGECFATNNRVLWGGNLSILVSLLGTPYFPNVRKGVLFLEDVGEHPYRIERMLTQLLHAGVLSSQKAIVLGQFSEYKLTDHDRGFKLRSAVEWIRSQTAVPVLDNFPYGHVPTKVLVPFGAKVDLVLKGRDALLAWGHI